MRPTALIRRMLQIEYLQEELAHRMKALKQELQSQGVTIIEAERRAMDVRVQYRMNGRHHEVLFMTPMLQAEAEGVFRQWLGQKQR